MLFQQMTHVHPLCQRVCVGERTSLPVTIEMTGPTRGCLPSISLNEKGLGCLATRRCIVMNVDRYQSWERSLVSYWRFIGPFISALNQRCRSKTCEISLFDFCSNASNMWTPVCVTLRCFDPLSLSSHLYIALPPDAHPLMQGIHAQRTLR